MPIARDGINGVEGATQLAAGRAVGELLRRTIGARDLASRDGAVKAGMDALARARRFIRDKFEVPTDKGDDPAAEKDPLDNIITGKALTAWIDP